MFEKERARERAKETRANIHKNDDGMAARKVAAKIIMLEELDTLKTVSAYCPINDELDALVTLKALHAARFPIALPAITDKDQPLEFRNWDMRTDLFDGPFNTKVSSEETVVPDVLLIPLLAFDEHG
jgi:5-formyltetrahydrofolate cyclo-ligase